KNLNDKIWMEDMEFEGNDFLVVDSLPNIDWKITKEIKDISGFQSYKAQTTLNDKYKTEVTAWYSPKLNFRNGPDKYWGLPGLILEVESIIKYENGAKEGISFKAVNIETIKKENSIQKPFKGNKVSENEFQKFVEDYYENLLEMMGGGVDKD